MEEWTVLLVDDEEEFISALAERLSFRGIQARTATNGEKIGRASCRERV